MSATFEELRKQTHRHFVLELRSDAVKTAFENPENIRQGYEKVIGLAGAQAGLPFPAFCEVRETESGAVAAMQLGDQTIFSVEAWQGGGLEACYRLCRLLTVYPALFFGAEQAIQWLEVASIRNAAGAAAAREALNDPTGYQSIAKILRRLVEERVPLIDANSVLEAIAAGGALPAGDDALWGAVERVRTAVRESAARHYMGLYAPRDRFDAADEFTASLADSGSHEAVDNALLHFLSGMERMPILVVKEANSRRQLWERTEALATEGKLSRPALVLKTSELPSTIELPGVRDTLRLVGARAVAL